MFTHIDSRGQPTMVDVSDKEVRKRQAVAVANICFPRSMEEVLKDEEIQSKKGPVFATAIIAGTMAVKNTSSLIPFCHPLPIDSCKIQIERRDHLNFQIRCEVKVTHKTGVEMEALTGASVTALTVYDMCKAFSHEIVISSLELVKKSGGKSDYRK